MVELVHARACMANATSNVHNHDVYNRIARVAWHCAASLSVTAHATVDGAFRLDKTVRDPAQQLRAMCGVNARGHKGLHAMHWTTALPFDCHCWSFDLVSQTEKLQVQHASPKLVMQIQPNAPYMPLSCTAMTPQQSTYHRRLALLLSKWERAA
jgi:hypothetical protein